MLNVTLITSSIGNHLFHVIHHIVLHPYIEKSSDEMDQMVVVRVILEKKSSKLNHTFHVNLL